MKIYVLLGMTLNQYTLFRGANIQNILNFKIDYPDYKLYKLEQNYRSTKNIVEVANSVIKNNEQQINKDVWTKNVKGELR